MALWTRNTALAFHCSRGIVLHFDELAFAFSIIYYHVLLYIRKEEKIRKRSEMSNLKDTEEEVRAVE